jgi:hypothetical protein
LAGEVVEENDFGSMRRNDLPQFPVTPADPLIVKRLNPVDDRAIGQ